jgi:hypothetical protein
MLIERDRKNKMIKVSQPGYILDLIDQFNVDTSYSPLTPMVDTPRPLISDTNPELNKLDQQLYQSKIGSCLWLANATRPDTLFAVNMLSRYTHAPTLFDMKAIDRVLQYIAGTPDHGLVFFSDEGVVLYCTVDASYGNHADRKSHSGCTLHIGRNSSAFLSRSKKQSITADSSTVAELIATHLASKEIMWARSLLAEMGYLQVSPTILQEDNMSTIHIINNDCNGQKTKHVDIRYNLVREQVQMNHIKMEHLPTKEMTSDILTKALAPTPFLYLRKKLLGMYSTLYTPNIISLFLTN